MGAHNEEIIKLLIYPTLTIDTPCRLTIINAQH